MPELQPSDVLFIPKRRRLTHAKLQSPEGQEVLHIFYGEKEIIFDEPELLSFGNKLLEVERFRADEAKSWSSDAPYDWEKVRPLLEALMEQEILKRHDETATPAVSARTFPPRLGRAPADRQPQTYSAHHDQCPVITEKTVGKPIDLSNLEVILPIYRVAHPALDQDGRQVGENNVADPLFLDLPTERRICKYAGNRFEAEVPMNLTALRHMTRRWPELLSLTEQYRTAFFERLPPQGSLRVGDVHLLAVGCLSVVGYMMVRGVDPVPNGQLDPGLAAMFRLIDGVRIVTTEMSRATTGPNTCDRIVNAKAIGDYAEQQSLFIDTWGVCAGPQALIEEYLQVLLDGASAPIQVVPDLATRLGDLPAALDYGLHGTRSEALTRVFGSHQGFLHERMRVALHDHAPQTKLQKLLEIPINRETQRFLRIDHPLRETLDLEIFIGRWLFERAGSGLPKDAGLLDSTDELLRFDPAKRASSKQQLAEFLAQVAPDYSSFAPPLRASLVDIAVEFFDMERICVRGVAAEQHRLNERLRRKQGNPLTSKEIASYERRATPSLSAVLAEGLGLSIVSHSHSTVLTNGQHTLTLAD